MAAGEPKVLGQPVTLITYAVCFIHLVLCVSIMAYLVIGTPLDLEGVLVSPLLQWIYGTFTLVSVVAIICAGVGALYHIESHLDVYGWILLASAVIDAVFFVVFLAYGRSCKTKHGNANHLVATLSCSVTDGMTLLCLTLLVVFKIFALFIVNKCRAYVRHAYTSNLMPFVRKHLSNLEASEEYDVAPPGAWMPNMPQTLPPGAWPSMGPAWMPNMPQTFANVMPSMRSNGTAFEQRPFPGMIPSMGPAMGMSAYGSAPGMFKAA